MAITNYIKEMKGKKYINGIEYTHPEYDKYSPLWSKARDILMGETELKTLAKREKYLARLGGHAYDEEGNRDYKQFVEYAMLFNATGRTVEAYRGLLNRKSPIVDLPKEIEDLKSNFTIKGESINTFLEQVETEVITTNRVGIFIDYPYRDSGSPFTKADEKKYNFSPYATMYPAESIINWEETRVNNKIVTSLVILREIDYVRIDSFTPVAKTTYRVLELDEYGYYRQIIVEPVAITEGMNRGSANEIKKIVYPRKNGEKLTQIPFIPVTAQGVTWTLSKSIIEDLVNVNLAHYRDTAFYEKAIAWTASPTAVFSGLPDEAQEIAIGSSRGIIIAPGGTAKYLEYEGRGLDAIKEALDSKENLMAVLGTKILATTAGKAESGEAALIHRAGEQGILSDVATTIEGVAETAIKIIADWRGAKTNSITVHINKDFSPIIMDANTLIAMGKELQAGNISHETYYWAMQRGELASATRSLEEELALIKKGRKMVVSKSSPIYVNKKDAKIIEEADEDIKKKAEVDAVVPNPLQIDATKQIEE